MLDTRHTFAGSIVLSPTYNGQNSVAGAILNNNQLGVMLQFNSGLPLNIRSNRDLNLDGVAATGR